MLDRDSDGMVSAEEIAHVVQHVLASESTETEAQAIAKDVSFDLGDLKTGVATGLFWLWASGFPDFVLRCVWNSEHNL